MSDGEDELWLRLQLTEVRLAPNSRSLRVLESLLPSELIASSSSTLIHDLSSRVRSGKRARRRTTAPLSPMLHPSNKSFSSLGKLLLIRVRVCWNVFLSTSL
mmetsp:Transcript_9777/g.29727  ORF Transcript_9777/g.29727 Transcript_9777/m.29727 type:complete len:102 (+) Transcript_9777:318-623(+)